MEDRALKDLPPIHATFEDFRFREYEGLSLRLSLAIAFLGPCLVFIQDLLLNPVLVHRSLVIGVCSIAALGLYPLALRAGMSRRWIKVIVVLTPAFVAVLDLQMRAGRSSDLTGAIVLLLYLIAYARILALPFGMPVTLFSIGMILMVPVTLKACGLIPGSPPSRVFIPIMLFPMVPMAMMMILLEHNLTRNLLENFDQRRRLEDLAIQDALTGLHNRRYFMLSAAEHLRLANRSGHGLCILMVDLDHFKRVNDTYGHATGDHVIRLMSDVLRQELRASDILARYGGEEFIACLPDTGQDAALIAAKRIRGTLEGSSLPVPGRSDTSLRVTASLGIASVKPVPESLEMLIERADKALYAAKHGGRNRVVCAA